LQFTLSYKEFSQRIIEPLMAKRRQVSIYSFMQLIIKFFVIVVTEISSNTQRAIVFLWLIVHWAVQMYTVSYINDKCWG